MSDVFFSSDTHFCHNQPFLYEPRGFQSVEEMNEAIIERWNKVVKPDDVVYHLGDIMLNDDIKGIEYFRRLNGQIFLIFGNHDSNKRKDLIAAECPYKMMGGWYAIPIKYSKFNLYLSHYPTLTANYDDRHLNQHVINLHGHTHQQTNFLNPSNPFMYHVGLDSHNCMPIHIDDIIKEIREEWKKLNT